MGQTYSYYVYGEDISNIGGDEVLETEINRLGEDDDICEPFESLESLEPPNPLEPIVFIKKPRKRRKPNRKKKTIPPFIPRSTPVKSTIPKWAHCEYMDGKSAST